MATTSVVSSGLATIAPELKPYYVGAGTAAVGTPGTADYKAASADYVPGLLPKAQEIYAQNYDQQIGNALNQSGLAGTGRVAGLSNLEQQVGQQVGAMQTPGQFGTGTDLASQAGQGQLGTVGQAADYGQLGANYGGQGVGIGQQAAGLSSLGLGYGGMGAGYGAQAANAGQNYAAQATNPYAQQAYMSPYIQNALAPQLQEMRRQYGVTGAQEMGNATRSGAFGGSREALMAAENNRNMGTAMNQAIGTGYQNAFTAANQAQQYGATLGLQGQQAGIQGAQAGLSGLGAANQAYQTGLQGTAQGMQGAQIGLQGVGAQQAGFTGANQAAATLGQLGTQQQAADLARLQAMSAQGATERGIYQQGLDTRYSDLMTKQQYPQTQLAGMQGILTGVQTPSNVSTQATTTPPPSFASQLAGTGLSGLALYNMFK